MPRYEFRLTTIIQALENDMHLAEALFFPEVSRLDDRRPRLENNIKLNAVRISEEAAPLLLHMRHAAGAAVLDEVRLTLAPPPKSVAWRKPLPLRFDILRYPHGDGAMIACVPALGIEVIARNLEELHERLPSHIHAHLLRLKKAASLGQLAWHQRVQLLNVSESSISLWLPTPKQLAVRQEQAGEEKKSALEEVTTDLTDEKLEPAYAIDTTVERLAEALTGRTPRSVLLVGPSGVGKTAAVHELVRRREPLQLGRTPLRATSGSRLIAGMSGYGMWQERCGRLWREASSTKTILHLGNLVELMEVGKSSASSQGIAAFFRPYIQRGDLQVIVECTPEQLPLIERNDPHLLDAFLQIKVEEPPLDVGRAILSPVVAAIAHDHHISDDELVTAEAVAVLDRLHRRYATYSAYPGRPLRFLKNLLADRQAVAITAEDVTARFSEETGLPLFLLNDAVRLDLVDAGGWFGERVIGQQDAVDLIVDLLATIKAGMTRTGRPIASLMFIGPTGVGKTEMAKSLAEFLFRSRERMIRFDMSEYADPIAVERLIGGLWGAEGLLTSKVREQPFAVILLDEFEKAHPSFFDLLLQVLGEGRLTDASGRLADFTNAVVIMTSNLGAETFKRNRLGFGEGTAAATAAREHFMKEVRAFVRPEFFNRIDRIVPFAPLDEATVLRVARRELEQVVKRDGILYRGVVMEMPDEVAAYLGRRGYDARYGARPLKRAIERDLLVPLAEQLNRQPADVALRAEVRFDEGGLRVAVQARTDAAGRPVSLAQASAGLGDIAARVADLRREVQALERSPATTELRNEIYRCAQLEKHLAKRTWKSPEDLERLGRLPELRHGIKQLEAMGERIGALEDDALLALYGKSLSDRQRLDGRLAAAANEWQNVLLAIYALQFKQPNQVTLAVYGESVKWLALLGSAYCEVALQTGAQIEAVEFAALNAEEAAALDRDARAEDKPFDLLGRRVIKLAIAEPKSFVAALQAKTVGVAFHIHGLLAAPRLGPERGLHLLREAKHQHHCLVHTSEARLADYRPPAGLEKRASIRHQDERRVYDAEKGVIEDPDTAGKLYFNGPRITEALRSALEQRLIRDARALLES